MLCFYDRSNKNANIEQKGERKWEEDLKDIEDNVDPDYLKEEK